MTLNPDRHPPRHGPNPRMQPHVLVITGGTADEREYEVEHPAECPIICYWSPGARERINELDIQLGLIPPGRRDPGYHDCYVQYEVESIGLDSLNLGENAPDDGTYTPLTQWSMDDWRRLPPGRYVIEPWHHQGSGLMLWGEDESEGGLNFIGREKSRR